MSLALGLTIFLLALCFQHGQSIDAVNSTRKLPSPRCASAAVYDGVDSIYIIGGARPNGDLLNEVVRFNVTSGTVEIISRFGVSGLFGGTTLMDNNGDIFYFGGIYESRNSADVWKWTPSVFSLYPQVVAQLPVPNYYHTSSTDGQGSAYLVGGTDRPVDGIPTVSNSILKFNLSSYTSEHIGNLTTEKSDAASVFHNGSIFVFGGFDGRGNSQDIVEITAGTGANTLLPAQLELWQSHTSAVLHGNEAYVFSGFGVFKPQVTVFDTITKNVTAESVIQNLPPSVLHSSVLVTKLNRIYLIGGCWGEDVYDKIYYVNI